MKNLNDPHRDSNPQLPLFNFFIVPNITTLQGMEVACHKLTSALKGGEYLASRSGRFSPGEESLTPFGIGRCVGLKAGPKSGEEWNPSLLSPSLLTAA
jgi:hypothetical protein